MSLSEDFIPKVGVGEIKLGMSQVDIEVLLGKPVRRREKRRGRFEVDYDGFSLIYAPDNSLRSIELYPETELRYRGGNIFTDASVRRQLIDDDGNPQIISGVVVLLNLGLAMWGVDEDDDSNKSITVFSDGEWERLKHKMVPYVHN